MPAVVSLREVVDHLSFILDEFVTYLNRETGAIVTVAQDDLSPAPPDDEDARDYPDWQQELKAEAEAVLNSDAYLPLPGKFDIHEYAILQDYCHSIADDKLRNVLLDKIHGAGAFRRFKNAVHHFGLAEDWYRFRDQALKEIAVAWLERNGIDYTDDTERPRNKRGSAGAPQRT